MNPKRGKRIGVEIGSRDIHVAVVENGAIRAVISEALPEGLVRDGRILSYEALSDLMRQLRRRHRVRVRDAALVLPPDVCCCRRFTTALMTEKQLRFNLPYEFHEYITGAREDYFYDYALVSSTALALRDGGGEGEAGEAEGLDLMAAAVSKRDMADYAAAFHRAGFRLKTAVPDELALINLARFGGETGHRHCILDLGHSAVRLYMFEGDRFEGLRALDYGLSALDDVIAEEFNVDLHTAVTYRETGHEGCLALPRCRDVYNAIAVEVLKAVNFQRFSSGGQEPLHIHCCGGGIRNQELIEALRATLNLPLVSMTEFWPDLPGGLETDASLAASAVGAALQ